MSYEWHAVGRALALPLLGAAVLVTALAGGGGAAIGPAPPAPLAHCRDEVVAFALAPGAETLAACRAELLRWLLVRGCAEGAIAVARASRAERLDLRLDGPGPCAVRGAPVPGPARVALGWGVDLNAATASELESLPGIGAALAARIVESRAREGPFPDVESLDRVRGIGPVLVSRLRPFVSVSVSGEAGPK